MSKGKSETTEIIFVPPEYWTLLQATLGEAIGICNDIASQVEAHKRLGLHDANELLDRMNGQAREIRNLLELIETPF